MKNKTKKAAAKRFRVTPSGKIMRMRQMAGHLKANKSRTAKNRYKTSALVSKQEEKMVTKLLPFG